MFENLNRKVPLWTLFVAPAVVAAAFSVFLMLKIDDGWVASISLALALLGSLGLVFSLLKVDQISGFDLSLVGINLASLFLSAQAADLSKEGMKGFVDVGLIVGMATCLAVLALFLLASRILRRKGP